MKSKSFECERMALALAVAWVSLCLASQAAKPVKPPPSSLPTHQFIRLGTMGGTFAGATAANQFGEVAGSVELNTSPPRQHAFLVVPQDINGDSKLEWFSPVTSDSDRNALMIDLGVATGFEGHSSGATDINDAAQVLVNCRDDVNYRGPLAFIVSPTDVDGDGRPDWFLADQNGANALLQPLSPGLGVPVTAMYALGINASGQIVGLCNGRGYVVDGEDIDSEGVACTWYADANEDGANDLYQDLGAAVGLRGYLLPLQPTRINEAGQVVGRVPMDPVNTDLGDPFIITPIHGADAKPVWNRDTNGDGVNDLVVKLPLLKIGMWGNACGVNAAGVVVGWSQTPGGNPHAMMWSVDAQGGITTIDLGIMQGEAQCMAFGVNDSLQAVGVGRTYHMKQMDLTESAFLWENGVMKDLRSCVDQGALLRERRVGANGINNQGMVFGWAWDDVSAYPYIAVPSR